MPPRDPYNYLRKRVDRLEHFSFGNGDLGADERLRNIESTLSETSAALEKLSASLDEIAQERRDIRSEQRGFRNAIIVASVVITLVTGGSAIALLDSLAKVLALLPGG